MVYQGTTGLYHFLINVIPFISNSVVPEYGHSRYLRNHKFYKKNVNE